MVFLQICIFFGKLSPFCIQEAYLLQILANGLLGQSFCMPGLEMCYNFGFTKTQL